MTSIGLNCSDYTTCLECIRVMCYWVQHFEHPSFCMENYGLSPYSVDMVVQHGEVCPDINPPSSPVIQYDMTSLPPWAMVLIAMLMFALGGVVLWGVQLAYRWHRQRGPVADLVDFEVQIPEPPYLWENAPAGDRIIGVADPDPLPPLNHPNDFPVAYNRHDEQAEIIMNRPRQQVRRRARKPEHLRLLNDNPWVNSPRRLRSHRK